MSKARLVIGEDDVAMQYIIRKLLAPDYEIVAVAPDGQGVLDCIERHAPDVVLLDIRMPVLSGIAVARTLKRTMRAIRIIFVSTHNDDQYIQEAFRIGADGYVLKSRMVSDLRPAIETALAGPHDYAVAAPLASVPGRNAE
jgi:DNA-binding NarL/FixJ family response regulator